ncbi:MAG: MFS transporter [Bacteroidales bacterium]|nr:MFS transporter [Bacteroidales bacterium]
MATNKQNYTPAIVVMFALFFMIAFVTNFAGSMGVIVSAQFGASKALSQLGTLANFIAYLCMGIPAGIILKRKGYKFTALLAVIIGFIGVGIQWIAGPAQSFLVYVVGAFVAGFSMCLLNIVVNPLLNTLGGGGNKGNQLIQWGGSCNSVGGTIAPILLGYLIGGSTQTATVKDAAPAMVIAMAIFAVAALIIALTNIPEPHMETPEEKAARKAGKIEKDPHGPLSFRHFVLGAIAIFFYVGIEVGIPNTANLYFSGLEWVGPALTGTMIGAYWFCMMIGRLGGGIIGGKVSSKAMLTTVSIVAIVFLICFMCVAPRPAVEPDCCCEKCCEATEAVCENHCCEAAGEQTCDCEECKEAEEHKCSGNHECCGECEECEAAQECEECAAAQECKECEECECCCDKGNGIVVNIFGKTIPLALIFIMLCGLCTSVMWGAIFNLAAEGLGKYTAPASGIFMTLVCGGGIIPFVQNVIADKVGSVQSYWVIVVCLCYLLFYALVGSKNVNKDIKVD